MEDGEGVNKRGTYNRVKAAERRRVKMDLACQHVAARLGRVCRASIFEGNGLGADDVRAVLEVLRLVDNEIAKNPRLAPIREQVKVAVDITEIGSGVRMRKRTDHIEAQQMREDERERQRALAREHNRAYYEQNRDKILARRRAARQAKKGENQ